jgi:putative FmdB family regulatory protein
MPTYEYVCPSGHQFEKFQRMSGRPRAKCPTCGKPASRKISGGAGLVFKGSGFYITDYGKDGKGPRKEAPGEGAAKPETTAGEGKGEKQSAPAESAPAAKSEKPEKTEKPAAKKASE